jgi:hypothetical protein
MADSDWHKADFEDKQEIVMMRDRKRIRKLEEEVADLKRMRKRMLILVSVVLVIFFALLLVNSVILYRSMEYVGERMTAIEETVLMIATNMSGH